MNENSSQLAPVLYIPHGGGPLPLLGDAAHVGLTRFLREIPRKLKNVKAVLVISAHWEESVPTVMTAAQPGMLYDYYGFPPESYELKYPAPGSPDIAGEITRLLARAKLSVASNRDRDFDHGVFVPLMLMYPEANLPVLQLSLSSSLDPRLHLRIGEALQSLRGQGVLILGSGLSFHNLRPDPSRVTQASEQFDDWLQETCGPSNLTAAQRISRLMEWERAPQARFCHPREEHLLPLHVCMGAVNAAPAEVVYRDRLWNWAISGYLWR